MLILSLIAPTFAADPTITTLRQTSELPGGSTMAVVLWCKDSADSAALVAALEPRNDVQTLVTMNNPAAADVETWLKNTRDDLGGETYREIVISIACPATGGDTDEEILSNGLAFATLASGIAPLAQSSVWLFDTSRSTYGITADDATKYLRDVLAISSGSPGRFAGGGLIMAAASSIAATHGAKMTLEDFYYRGIKPGAPTLDLFTSMGFVPNDGWSGNMARMVFVGSTPVPVIANIAPPMMPKKNRKIPAGCVLASSGILVMIGSGAVGLSATGTYDQLLALNDVGGSQADLNAAVSEYETATGVALGLGIAGALATVGGVTLTVLDDGNAKVEIVPAATGISVRGSW